MMAAAALLAGCGGDATGPTGPAGPVEVRLADYPALGPVGGIVRVSASGRPVAVVHASQDVYQAFSMRCPHQGTTVEITGGAFVCPNHGARFSATGEWTGGQRTSSLAHLAVTYDATAGTLTIG